MKIGQQKAFETDPEELDEEEIEEAQAIVDKRILKLCKKKEEQEELRELKSELLDKLSEFKDHCDVTDDEEIKLSLVQTIVSRDICVDAGRHTHHVKKSIDENEKRLQELSAAYAEKRGNQSKSGEGENR